MISASMAVDALPAPTETVRELTTREKCREAINALAQLTGKSQHDLWSKAYGKYDLVHHTVSSVKQKNGGYKTRIDWFEAANRLDGLYAIISKMVDEARRPI